MDNGNEDDLGKFTTEEEHIKPIEVGEGTGARSDVAKEMRLPPVSHTDSSSSGGSQDESTQIKKGSYIDLTEKAPTLKKLVIGCGWERRSFDGEPVDLDFSLFLLDKNGMTRIDEDFIFYNNPSGCDGAIRHIGDSRRGAGEGDDEAVNLDLNGIPFDVLRVVCALSVYDPDFQGRHFGEVRDLYLRFVNKDDSEEIARYILSPEICKGGNAMIIGLLIREGPRWIFEATTSVTNGGLAKLATDYGIIVKELQSTGEERLGDI